MQHKTLLPSDEPSVLTLKITDFLTDDIQQNPFIIYLFEVFPGENLPNGKLTCV